MSPLFSFMDDFQIDICRALSGEAALGSLFEGAGKNL